MTPPTSEFLNELIMRARLFGWAIDYGELVSFIRHLHDEAGLPQPANDDLEPIVDEEPTR